MQTISEILRSKRLEQGISLAAVAAVTRINAKYLRAIEADDIASLPGTFFYKSFVHQYATCLGMDTQALDAEVDRVLNAQDFLPSPEIGAESGQRWFFQPGPATTYLAYAAAVLVLVAGIGMIVWKHKSSSIPVSSASAPGVEAGQTVPAPAASPVVIAQPEPSTGSKIELALKATEDTWLSVSSDGTPVFSGLLAANQTKTVESKETANLRVGNAAGLEVRLNGTPLGSLGAHGQIRDLTFTPNEFQFRSQHD
jgi:cytoskeleton protein RodZ